MLSRPKVQTAEEFTEQQHFRKRKEHQKRPGSLREGMWSQDRIKATRVREQDSEARGEGPEAMGYGALQGPGEVCTTKCNFTACWAVGWKGRQRGELRGDLGHLGEALAQAEGQWRLYRSQSPCFKVG